MPFKKFLEESCIFSLGYLISMSKYPKNFSGKKNWRWCCFNKTNEWQAQSSRIRFCKHILRPRVEKPKTVGVVRGHQRADTPKP